MKSILGKKLVMTQVFKEDGTVVPVTRVQVGPCVVVQVKQKEKDSSEAVQIGFGSQKPFRANKAKTGHTKGLPFVPQYLKDVPLGADHGLKRGDVFTAESFEAGEKITVTGKSKGRGFQGVVKRHGFAGSPASHGHKDQLRMPGSIGATDAARVFKGTRMGGHMGDAQVTVKNLEIVAVDADKNEILLKGAVPGARNSLLVLTCKNGKVTPVATETTKQEVPTESTEEVKEKVEQPTEDKKTETKEDAASEDNAATADEQKTN